MRKILQRVGVVLFGSAMVITGGVAVDTVTASTAQAATGIVCHQGSSWQRPVLVAYSGGGSTMRHPGGCTDGRRNAFGFKPPIGYQARWRYAGEDRVHTCIGKVGGAYCSTAHTTVIIISVTFRGSGGGGSF